MHSILFARDGIYQSTRTVTPGDMKKTGDIFSQIFSAPYQIWELAMAYWQRDRVMSRPWLPLKPHPPVPRDDEDKPKPPQPLPASTQPAYVPNVEAPSRMKDMDDAMTLELLQNKRWNDGMKQVDNGLVYLKAIHRPMPDQIPRGSIAITGITEAVGPKGRLTVSFVCVFDPKTHGIISIALTTGPVRPHSQYPKGGWS
jgi:hypothetical protein